MPRTRKQQQKLRQQTLTGFITTSSPERPSPSPSPVKSTVSSSRIRAPPPNSSPDDVEDSDGGVGAIHFEPEVIVLNESDEDASPRRSPSGNKRRTRLQHATSVQSDKERQSSAEEEEGAAVHCTSKRKAKRRQVEISDDDTDEPRPRKRKLVKGTRPRTPEDDILAEVDEDQIIDTRLRARGKQTVFQRNLEKFKRKKQGKPASESSSSQEEDDDEDKPFPDAHPNFNNDNDFDSPHEDETEAHQEVEDSFIVEDDGGAPVAQLPMMFSMNTHQELIHHFKVICQLFVHLAVRPRGERHAFMEQTMNDEDYFSVPLQIARRKLSGMRDSLVASSVWRPDFKKPLETYPEFEMVGLDFAVPACDACHLGGRMSTRLGRLSGEPYDRLTYEPLGESIKLESDKSSGDDDHDSDYEQSKVIKEFNLGRFCAVRTQVFHKFMHWEYTLYTSLARQVKEAQDNTRGYIRVAFAQGARQPPTNTDDADGFMDWLDERGVIDAEWQIVKEMMERARNLEMMAKKGDDDMD